MNKPPMLKRVANFVYEKFANKPGDFLLISGTIGWAASCVNQTVAIMINDKIPKEQKYFLIPQEITDGIVNTLLYIGFTRTFTRFGEKFVESGKWANSEIRAKLKLHGLDKRIGEDKFNLLEQPQLKPFDPKFDPKFSKEYYKLADGISFAFSTLGAVISCDFVTPFVRNKIASYRQKQSLEKDRLAMEKTAGPAQPMQNDLDKKSKKALNYYNNPYTTIGGRMKI